MGYPDRIRKVLPYIVKNRQPPGRNGIAWKVFSGCLSLPKQSAARNEPRSGARDYSFL